MDDEGRSSPILLLLIPAAAFPSWPKAIETNSAIDIAPTRAILATDLFHNLPSNTFVAEGGNASFVLPRWLDLA